MDYSSCPVSGTLDHYGDLVFTEDCVQTFYEFRILGSGDVTSQGYVEDVGDSACYPLAQSAWQPLWKSETDLPTSDSPFFDSSDPWTNIQGSGSQYATYGNWDHAVSPFFNGYVEFAGRFVFEQSGGTASDGRHFEGSQHPAVTNVITGGGWYVNAGGDWGDDAIGMMSQWISY